jgi:hypothetical protein
MMLKNLYNKVLKFMLSLYLKEKDALEFLIKFYLWNLGWFSLWSICFSVYILIFNYFF